MIKTFRLLVLLSTNRKYSRPEIMERLKMSERAVYRQLNFIEDAGFVLNRDNGRYQLVQSDSTTKDLQKIIHFSDEEIAVFYKALKHIKAPENIESALLNKIDKLYNFQLFSRLEKEGYQNKQEKIILITQAIQKKKKIKLIQYHSSNSGNISDREVEPFQFTAEFDTIWCLDNEDHAVKQFKLSRLDAVKILKSNWENEALHQTPFTDAFRMSAKAPIATVQLQLNLKAYNLLKEEFPLAEDGITKINNHYELKIQIANFYGIGRFVLGLPGDIQILGPAKFKQFIKERVSKHNH